MSSTRCQTAASARLLRSDGINSYSRAYMSDVQYQNPRSLLAALRRIEGQARGVQRMIETERPCSEVVQQLSALRGAADRLSHRLVAENLRACLADMDLPEERRSKVEQGLRVVAELRS